MQAHVQHDGVLPTGHRLVVDVHVIIQEMDIRRLVFVEKFKRVKR